MIGRGPQTFSERCEDAMSAPKHVSLPDKDPDVEKWSYIEWVGDEVGNEVGDEGERGAGVSHAHTQTDRGPAEDKETQTSSPVIMHMDLTRTRSKLRHSSLLDADASAPPFFQFDRQAPGRISTSPTLRRMRSTRRPLTDTRDPARMGSTEEEPSSPAPRVTSPLVSSASCEGGWVWHQAASSSCGRQRTRSHRSKTLDNGVTSPKDRCAHPALGQNLGFPDTQVSSCSGGGRVGSNPSPSSAPNHVT